jgi:hypothetical protein
MIAPPRSGGSGLAGKSDRKTANVCDKHAKETTRNTAARFMLFLNHCSTEIAEQSSREKLNGNEACPQAAEQRNQLREIFQPLT